MRQVWVDLQGTEVLPEEVEILQHEGTGGVLLFSRNYQNYEQVNNLIREIRKIAQNPDLLIAVDHEGGRIWRFGPAFRRPPAAELFGRLYVHDSALAKSQLELAGKVIAQDLLRCQIDLSFTPVLDVDHGLSQVIGDRAYHHNPNIITQCADALIQGMNAMGMQAVGKHFPGHGGCEEDTHIEVAQDRRSLEALMQLDILPFKNLKDKLAGIMPAHILYPNIDKQVPNFSEYWLQTVLRKQIGFHGAIISDCLSMHAATSQGGLVSRAQAALNAGCDMIIIAQQSREVLLKCLDALHYSNSAIIKQRIKALQGNFNQNNLDELLPELGTLENIVIAET